MGAGRRPKALTVNWDELARTYYSGNTPLDAVCSAFGVSHADLLAYGAQRHWLARPPRSPHPDDLGDLASALAHEMFGIEKVADRAPRFVAAMVALGARDVDIAEALQIGLAALKSEFATQLRR